MASHGFARNYALDLTAQTRGSCEIAKYGPENYP